MLKEVLDQSAVLSSETAIDERSGKEKFSSLSQPGGMEHLLDKLKDHFLSQNPQILEAFKNFLDVIPVLYNNLPYQYASILADFFWGKLQYDECARTMLVQVFLNSIDRHVLTAYCKTVLEEELKTLAVESPFRLALIKLFNKWSPILNDKKNKFYCYCQDEIQERLAQLRELYVALSKINTSPSVQKEAQEKFYPDDQLVETVESILQSGKTYEPAYWESQLSGKEHLGAFLDQLKMINNERLSKKLLAHDKTLIGQDCDMLLALKILHAENIHHPYYHRIFSILQALLIRNSKLIDSHEHLAQEQKEVSQEQIVATSIKETKDNKEKAKLQKDVIALQSSVVQLIRKNASNPPQTDLSPRPIRPTTGDGSIRRKAIRSNAPHTICDISSEQSKTLTQLVEDNEVLKSENCELSVKLADAESRCASLPNVERDNRELRRQLAELHCRVEYLEFQVAVSKPQKPANPLYNPSVKWQLPNSNHLHDDPHTHCPNSDNEDQEVSLNSSCMK